MKYPSDPDTAEPVAEEASPPPSIPPEYRGGIPLEAYRRDRHGNRLADRSDWQGTRYAARSCIRCGSTIAAPASRMPQVFRMHAVRCDEATKEERLAFCRTRRWPRQKKSPVQP